MTVVMYGMTQSYYGSAHFSGLSSELSFRPLLCLTGVEVSIDLAKSRVLPVNILQVDVEAF